jgi:hypothetical protein
MPISSNGYTSKREFAVALNSLIGRRILSAGNEIG